MNNTIKTSIINAYRIDDINNRIKANKKKQIMLKVISIFLVFMEYVDTKNTPYTSKRDDLFFLLFTLIFIIIFFVYNIKIIYHNRDMNFLKYNIEKEELEERKELAIINGEELPDYIASEEILVPSIEVKPPIIYYLTLIILDILIFLIF